MSSRVEIQSIFKEMILSSTQSISVSLICHKMNISRKNFCKYYDNIQDLIHKIIKEDIFFNRFIYYESYKSRGFNNNIKYYVFSYL